MKHTQGEFEMIKYHDNTFQVGIKGTSIVVAELNNLNEAEANAKLIAAAPEMLEALKKVREMIAIKNGKAIMNTSPEFVKETIEALIKKATE